MSLARSITEAALSRGFDLVGFTSARRFHVDDGNEQWTADPATVLPEARTLVIGAIYLYGFETAEPDLPGEPRATFGPWTRASQVAEVYGKDVLLQVVRDHGWQAEIARGMPLKMAAVRANIASYGKNCITHAGGFGSHLKYVGVITDAPVECVDRSPQTSDCGQCTACIDACPTGALDRPYHLDRSRCICQWLWGHPMPRELRHHVGAHVFRCGYCQTVCPRNKRLRPRTEFPFQLEDRSDRPPLIPLLIGNDETLRRLLPGFVANGAGLEMVRRNVAVALGNAGDPAAIPALAHALPSSSSPAVRGAAAWALGRLGGRAAAESLRHALTAETDAEVIDEIRAALDNCPAVP